MYLRTALLLILLTLLLSAEACTTDADCVHTQCPAGSAVLCQRPDGATVTDTGLCTCTDAAIGGVHRTVRKRKHGPRFYPRHLLPSGTETNEAGKQQKTLPIENDNMNVPMTDESLAPSLPKAVIANQLQKVWTHIVRRVTRRLIRVRTDRYPLVHSVHIDSHKSNIHSPEQENGAYMARSRAVKELTVTPFSPEQENGAYMTRSRAVKELTVTPFSPEQENGAYRTRSRAVKELTVTPFSPEQENGAYMTRSRAVKELTVTPFSPEQENGAYRTRSRAVKGLTMTSFSPEQENDAYMARSRAVKELTVTPFSPEQENGAYMTRSRAVKELTVTPFSPEQENGAYRTRSRAVKELTVTPFSPEQENDAYMARSRAVKELTVTPFSPEQENGAYRTRSRAVKELTVTPFRTRRSTSELRKDDVECYNSRGEIIAAPVCDGFYHCWNRLDEENCHVGRDRLECYDGIMARVCDGFYDCASGLDEKNCHNRTCPSRLTIHCDAGLCYDVEKRCDGEQTCNDNSDEENCDTIVCPDYFFRCKSGQCIFYLYQCDGEPDCTDESDELNCQQQMYPDCTGNDYLCPDGTCMRRVMVCDYLFRNGFRNDFITCPNKTNEISCADYKCFDPDYVKCNSGHCIDWKLWCNARFDCPDRSDESSCANHTCPNPICETFLCTSADTNFQCNTGHCILSGLQCNGRKDCPDHSDEDKHCDNYLHPVFEKCFDIETQFCTRGRDAVCFTYGTFHCHSGHCVRQANICDQKLDCPDGSDESSCENHTCDTDMFQCTSGHCIDEGQRCDMRFDCPDDSDEMNCHDVSCHAWRLYTYSDRCDSGQCYDLKFRCNRYKDCLDNSDERNCQNITCPDHHFRCSSGQCVLYFRRCNGIRDCTDWSDENDCPEMYCPESYSYRCTDGRCISLTLVCDHYLWEHSRNCINDFDDVSCENHTCMSLDYFRCNDGRCIYPEFRCDSKPHCPDGSDEDEATCDCPFKCPNGKCILERHICNGYAQCSDWSDEENCNRSACSSSTYQCKIVECIPMDKLCDGYFNGGHIQYECPKYEDDEKHCPFLKCPINYLRMPTGNCLKPVIYNINCSNSQISNRCPNSCPNNIHYRQCCNCQCIHRVSICDGINDCPDKADERNCGIPDCRDDQFYCGTINCFPSDLLCDGFAHCLDEHDETNCTLSQSKTFTEDDTFLAEPGKSDQFIDDKEQCIDPSICFTSQDICYIKIGSGCKEETSDCFLLCESPCTCSNVGIMRCNQWGENMTAKNDLNMWWPFNTSSRNSIYSPGYQYQWFFTFETMAEISITNSSLTRVPTGLLSCAFNIHHLDLSYNAITNIAVGDFGHLYRLSVLDLSNNLIASIEDYSFKGIRVLHLRLNKNEISKVGIDLFSGMAVDGTITTDEYRFCCLRPTYFPEQNCYPKADQFSSCKDLMKNPILSVMLWIIGLVSLLGNVGILLFKITVDRGSLKKNFGVMVTNLAVADALMGVYLLSIASVDTMYRGIYITKDNEWRNSIGCKLLGVLCTISSEASVLFICLITVDRYLITKYPFGQVRLGRFILNTMCVCIWIIAVAIATTPFIISSYFNGNYYSKSGVCIALPLTTESYDGWEYSFAINVCLNCILFLIVGIGQYLIYKEIRASQNQILVSTRRNNDMKIARRLMFIALSDFFCWIPIGVLGILALAGVEIPSDVYAWVTVFVLPINSALNPFLYTLISLICTA